MCVQYRECSVPWGDGGYLEYRGGGGGGGRIMSTVGMGVQYRGEMNLLLFGYPYGTEHTLYSFRNVIENGSFSTLANFMAFRSKVF